MRPNLTENKQHLLHSQIAAKLHVRKLKRSKSLIDYVITNKNVYPSKILDVRVLTLAKTGTKYKEGVDPKQLKLKSSILNRCQMNQ